MWRTLMSYHFRASANFMKFMNVCILCCIMSLLLSTFCSHVYSPHLRSFPPLFYLTTHPSCLQTSAIFLTIVIPWLSLTFHFKNCNFSIWFFIFSPSVPFCSLPHSQHLSFFPLNPIFPLPLLLHPSLYVFVFLHPSRTPASSQITITRAEECVLEDNSQRTKWKVISPTGNEAMVPSVCFTIPPPNQEAMDAASR